jgi:Fic family protein
MYIMMTFRQFSSADFRAIPLATGWALNELGQALGRQELFTRQSPHKLKKLREHAIVESAISSNRIEGVQIDPARAATLVFGTPLLRDRDEEEVRGYRDALSLIHQRGRELPLTESMIRDLHRMCRGQIWDAGQYKQKTEPIVEHRPDGTTRVRFMPVEAGPATESAMAELVERCIVCIRDRVVPPLVAVGALGLDFLCIHPFRDGNGRVARLLMLLLCSHAGAEVGRYISLERLIEQSKDRYYETLEQCSQGWHDAKHDPWSFINYILWVIKTAYAEFERRVGEVRADPGEKSAMVLRAVERMVGDFSVAQLQQQCPGVSLDLIRRVLKDLQRDRQVQCLGRGRAALWRRTGNGGPRN